MWWKLVGLTLGTVLLILLVIPIRTHAVRFDPENPPPPMPFFPPVSSLYFTPGTIALIATILVVAVFIGVRIVRG